MAVDLVYHPGIVVKVKAWDGVSDEVVPRVFSEVVWMREDESGWIRQSAFTGDTEPAVIPNCLATSVYFFGAKEGWVARPLGPLVVPWDNGESVPIKMDRVVDVEGVVTANGKPVQDFSVTHSFLSNPRQRRNAPFEDRPQGEFEIERVPELDIDFLAYTERMVPATVVQLRGEEVGAEPIELSVEPPALLEGVVLARGSREPIANALVRGYLVDSFGFVEYWGEGVRTDAEGRFQGLLGQTVEGGVWVTADGYGPSGLIYEGAASGSRTDIGEVVLGGKQDLVVRLKSEDPFDRTRWNAVSRSDPEFPSGPFSPEGEVQGGEISEGSFHLEINRPGTQVFRLETDLVSGEPWEFDLPVRVGRDVVVEFEGIPEEDLLTNWLFAEYELDGWTVRVIAQYDEASRTVTMDSVPGGPVQFSMLDRNGFAMGELRTVVPVDGDQRLLLQGLDRDREIRIVDQEGSPLVDEGVQFQPLLGEDASYTTLWTDEDGVVPAPRGLAPEVLVQVYYSDSHRTWWTVLDLENLPKGRHEFVFDPRTPLELGFRRGGQPVPGIQYALCTRTASGRFDSGSTGGSGDIPTWTVTPGIVRVLASGDGWWPQEYRLDVPEAGLRRLLEVRARTNLSTRVNAGGLLRRNTEVELHHLDLEESAAEWIADGRVEGSLQTDGDGRLNLTGIPEGRYRIQLQAADGTFEREFELVGGQDGPQVLNLDG